MSAEWPLSAVEFDVLWREQGLAEPPYPLELESPGTSYEERARLVAEVMAGLAEPERGIAQDGAPVPVVATALATLAGADVLVDGRLVFDGLTHLVATRVGDLGVMVLQRGDQLWLRSFDGARLGSVLVDLLPSVRPATGQSVRLSYRALTGALTDLAGGGSLWDFEQALKADGVRGQDVRWLAGVLGGGADGRGAQLGVSVRGRRTGLLSWHDSPLGGVFAQRHGDTDWITVAPGDPAKAVARLEELVATR